MTVIMPQGSTGYIPSTVQVNSSSYTIRWQYGITPTPTSNSSKIDIFSFTLLYRSSTWNVFASAALDF